MQVYESKRNVLVTAEYQKKNTFATKENSQPSLSVNQGKGGIDGLNCYTFYCFYNLQAEGKYMSRQSNKHISHTVHNTYTLISAV